MFSVKRKVFLLILALFFSVAANSANAADAANDRITEVVVKGNKLTDSSAIILVIKSKTGEALSSEKVNQDVKNIYKMGRFQDLRCQFVKEKLKRFISLCLER